MSYRNGILALAFAAVASAGIRPSFMLSKCAWEATDVIELAIGPGEGHFQVVATIKGASPTGVPSAVSSLRPPPNEHALLKDLSAHCDLFGKLDCREDAPPIRASDRLIVFLRAGQPAESTMLTSAIWLQDGKAYAFEQTFNPGPSHLEEFHPPSQRFEKTKNGFIRFYPESTEVLVRSDIAQLLRWRDSYDKAVSNPNRSERVAALVRLAASGDLVVVRVALDALSSERPEAAYALRSLLDDDSLLYHHFQILDTIAALKVRDIRFDSIIRHEKAYWTQMCDRDLGNYWTRNYGEPTAYHFLRVVSVLKAIQALAVDQDVPAVREFAEMVDHCQNLKGQQELREVIIPILSK